MSTKYEHESLGDPEDDVRPNLPAHMRVEPPQIWERLPRESDRDWALFSTYRLSGYKNLDPTQDFVPRSLARFAADCALSPSSIYALSGQFSWNERCTAFDRLIDNRKTHATLSAIDRMRSRHERMDALRLELWEASMARLIDDHHAGRVSLKPGEADALGRTLQASELLRNGEATARTETKSLAVSVSLQGAPADVIAWYRAQALSAANPTE